MKKERLRAGHHPRTHRRPDRGSRKSKPFAIRKFRIHRNNGDAVTLRPGLENKSPGVGHCVSADHTGKRRAENRNRPSHLKGISDVAQRHHAAGDGQSEM